LADGSSIAGVDRDKGTLISLGTDIGKSNRLEKGHMVDPEPQQKKWIK